MDVLLNFVIVGGATFRCRLVHLNGSVSSWLLSVPRLIIQSTKFEERPILFNLMKIEFKGKHYDLYFEERRSFECWRLETKF